MIWKCLILVLACASAARIQHSKQSRSGHNDEEATVQPYHKALQKVEAATAALDEVLDHPTSKPPINEVPRHVIALAYTIHYVAYQMAISIDPWFDVVYYDLMDEGYQKGLHSPVEAVQEIQEIEGKIKNYIQPAADLIHELCGKSKDSSDIESCDMLVAFAIQIDPHKYENKANLLVEIAHISDIFKPLLSEMEDACDSFTEEAYLINNKDKLRYAISSLSEVYWAVI